MKLSILRPRAIEDAPKCYDLMDDHSPLATSLTSFVLDGGSEFGYNVMRHIVESVGDLVPGFSRCAANTNTMSIFQIIVTSQTLRTCGNALSQFTIPNKLLTTISSDTRYAHCTRIRLSHASMRVSSRSYWCDDGPDCECYNEFKNTIVSAFGADLTTTVDALLKFVDNSMCSVKTFKSEKLG
uniref:Uncharacterized protein n=1 Tax=Globisporangium ultimum (strain ATCC 200006 / CBS 805.95 / DAOM BR144) TaxID=431595 RepID=K3WF43_GLOUD